MSPTCMCFSNSYPELVSVTAEAFIKNKMAT
ncbi:unnamed protein product [Gulo gulo]|uniref:Uncharacterized protein n=1 Tax=Gulo gulo TaxID=48420 RepID=A0A9X9PYA1_GULGU|nr:unnamed protein product [Gulo gulo]